VLLGQRSAPTPDSGAACHSDGLPCGLYGLLKAVQCRPCQWGMYRVQQCYRVNIQLPLQIGAQHAAQMNNTWLKAVQWSQMALQHSHVGVVHLMPAIHGTHGMPPTMCRPSILPMVCHPSILAGSQESIQFIGSSPYPTYIPPSTSNTTAMSDCHILQ
jgi:hypothetical protein